MPAWRHFPSCALGDVHGTGSHGRLGKVGGGAGARAEGLHQKREGPAARAGEVRRVRVCCWGVHLCCDHPRAGVQGRLLVEAVCCCMLCGVM